MGNSSEKPKYNCQSGKEFASGETFTKPTREAASFRSFAGSERSGVSRFSSLSRRKKYSKSFSAEDGKEDLRSKDTQWPIAYFEAMFLEEFRLRPTHFRSGYETVRELSSGSFGKVYLAKSKTSGEFYATKILSKAQIIQEKAVQQVKDEVSIQLMCGHNPFIASCIEYWQGRREIYIVSEFAERGDLLKLWSVHGPMEEDLVRIYVVQISSAIDFLHNAGVIYRDLKLENIVVKTDGSARLVDFGLSKWLKMGQRTKTICGTLFYMAPEILKGEAYGHSIDFWSLGVLIYALLAGEIRLSRNGSIREINSISLTTALLTTGLVILAKLDRILFVE